MDYAKYENYIRVGHTATKVDGVYVCSDLVDFPTPSAMGRTLHDMDKDPFTDLLAFTHRNRVRSNIEDITLEYNVLSDDDQAFILNALDYEWVYVELIDKKTKEKKTHKMYAGDRTWDTFKADKYYFYQLVPSYGETTPGALHIVSNGSTPGESEIRLQDVTPTIDYTPEIGDYVLYTYKWVEETVAFTVSLVEE